MNDFNGNKELQCNLSLVKALMQFVSVSDRKKIQEWVAKLQEGDDGMSDCKIKNEYSFYLLINLQNGTLMQPFNKNPPEKLKPLCRILPDYLYEDIQNQFKLSYCRLSRILNSSNDFYEMPDLRCEPSGFHNEQPRPRKGISASFAVFSNYEDESN